MVNALQAIEWLLQGRKIRSTKWNTWEYMYLSCVGSYNYIFLQTGDRYVNDFSFFFNNVWELWKEEYTTGTFPEALNAFQKGKKVMYGEGALVEKGGFFKLEYTDFCTHISSDKMVRNDWHIYE